MANALRPVQPSADPIQITVSPGMDSTDISYLLQENGLIRNGLIFKYYLRFKNEGSRFQAGTYAMTPGMTIDQIIEMLNKGDTVRAETIRFTIPEGFTIMQIADTLSGLNYIDRSKFLRLADRPEAFAGLLSSHIPDRADLRHRLEGYLFPETYEMKKGSTEEDIIRRMLEELERKLSGLPEGWRNQLKENNIDFHQMMTIASLIEREVVVDDERPIVAGVIYNRLKAKMPLQIDATVQYLFDKPKERLFEKDLRMESPYNTYLHEGLPPGPIASPGLESIRAALYPKKTNYLFYVTKKDGTQRHLFAETYEQHKKNIAASKMQGSKQGG